MLPNGVKYVDVDVERYGIIHHYEQKAFADIYPRRVGVVSSVRSKEVKDKDGKPFTIYYFKDDNLNFDPNDYEIAGLVKHVSFQEGSELAGLGADTEHYSRLTLTARRESLRLSQYGLTTTTHNCLVARWCRKPEINTFCGYPNAKRVLQTCRD